MRGKDGENNGCNQPAEPSSSMLFCSYYTRLGRLTVNWQLAAMNSQKCTSDSPGGGLLTPDRALIDWLRKFHTRIGGLLCSSLSPTVWSFSFGAFYSQVFICLFSLSLPPKNIRLNVTEGVSWPRLNKSNPHLSQGWVSLHRNLLWCEKWMNCFFGGLQQLEMWAWDKE